MNTKVDTLLNKLNTNYKQLRMDHEELKTKLSTLQNYCEYLESQSRRNNLVFPSFEESGDETWEDCESKIKTYMSDDLSLDPGNVVIERAHRLGNGNKPRPIIAMFLSYKDKQKKTKIE